MSKGGDSLLDDDESLLVSIPYMGIHFQWYQLTWEQLDLMMFLVGRHFVGSIGLVGVNARGGFLIQRIRWGTKTNSGK